MGDYQPVTDWRTDWDHADPAWAADPFTITDELRQSCPVAHTRRYGGAWMPTTLALIDEVLHDTATYSSRETGVRPPGTNTKKSPPITSDPPEHQDHRRVLLASFAPKAVARLEPELRAYCRSLVGAVGGRERFDAAASYSQHIPTKALAGLLGLLLAVPLAACPLTGVLESQIRTELAPLQHIDGFRVDWQWLPAWRPADITDSGREQLRAIGFTL